MGSPNDPGLMVLCLEKIFADRDTVHRGEDLTVTCSYLEVYNEVGVQGCVWVCASGVW